MSWSLVLVLVMAVCIVGLLALAAATFFPTLSLRSRRPERGPKQLTDLADRLSPYAVTRPAVIDLVAAERPDAQTGTAKTAKTTGARKTAGARKSAAPRRSRAAAK